MKKYIAGLFTGILVTLSITTFATTAIKEAYFNTDIKIVDQSKGQLNTEIVTVIKDGETSGRNYVSVSDLSQALGKTVTWDGSTKTINLSESTSAPTPTPTPEPTSNIKVTTYKDCPAIEKDGIIYVKLAEARQLFNYSVGYDAPMVTLSKGDKKITFDKNDTDYCIQYGGLVYVKLSIAEQLK